MLVILLDPAAVNLWQNFLGFKWQNDLGPKALQVYWYWKQIQISGKKLICPHYIL